MIKSLETLLQDASEGEHDAILDFLRAFQTATLIVPEKEQIPRFDFLPAYPDRPLNILAIQDGNNVTVPVFSETALVSKWYDRPLKLRSIKTCDLIKLLPEDWWLALNPGDELRKDFSPWELKRILGGEEELAEISTDLELERGVEPLLVRKLIETEFAELRAVLKELASQNPAIKEVFLAIEEGKTVEGSKVETLLVGIKVKDLPNLNVESIRTSIRDALAPLLIGSVQLRLLLGVGFSDLELGVFADISPVFSNE